MINVARSLMLAKQIETCGSKINLVDQSGNVTVHTFFSTGTSLWKKLLLNLNMDSKIN